MPWHHAGAALTRKVTTTITLKEARKYIKLCEKHPLRYQEAQLISQGPGEGWCVTIALVRGGSNIVYSVAEMHPYPRSAYDLNYNDLNNAE